MRLIYSLLVLVLSWIPWLGIAQTVDFAPYYSLRTSLGRELQFRDWSVPSQGGQILSYQWSFPGGSPSVSTSRLPRVTYNSSGIFPVSLTIYDSNTGYRTLTRNNFVKASNDTLDIYVNCDRVFLGWNRVHPYPSNNCPTLDASAVNGVPPYLDWIPWNNRNPFLTCPMVTTIYTVNGSNNTGSDIDFVRVDVVSQSEVPLPRLNAQYSFCQGDANAQVCLNEPECGLNYTWMADSLGGTILGNGECFNRQGNLAQNVGSTVYWVRSNPRYGYAYLSPAVPVTVTITPRTAVVLSGDQSFCAGASPMLMLANFNGNVLRWEQSTDGGLTYQSIAHTQTFYIPPPLNQTTRFRVLVEANGNGCFQPYSTIATVSVIPNSVGGNVTADASFCTYGSGILNLTGHSGNILRWESSTDNFLTTSIINNRTVLQLYSNLTRTTRFRALIQALGCAPVYSNPATITINYPPFGGQLSRMTGCSGSNGTITLSNASGTVIRWESSTDNFTTATSINHTLNTYNYNITTTTQFRAVVGNPPCPNAYSTVLSINPGTSLSVLVYMALECNNRGKIVAMASGGSPTYVYRISPASGSQFTSGTFTNVLPGTYVLTVTDQSNCSISRTLTIPNVVTPPRVLAVAPLGLGRAMVRWEPVNGTVTYQIRYKLQSDVSWLTLPTTNSTFYNLTGLIPNRVYEVQVRVGCLPGPNWSAWGSSFNFSVSSREEEFLVSEASSPTVRVYPNPNKGNFTIAGGTGEAYLYDGLGRLVWSGVLKEEAVETEVSGLASGLYTLKVSASYLKIWVEE